MQTRSTSKSNQKWVINHQSEAMAHWPTPHSPFLKVSNSDPELAKLYQTHWDPHEKQTVERIAEKLSASIGTKYCVRNVEISDDDVRRHAY